MIISSSLLLKQGYSIKTIAKLINDWLGRVKVAVGLALLYVTMLGTYVHMMLCCFQPAILYDTVFAPFIGWLFTPLFSIDCIANNDQVGKMHHIHTQDGFRKLTNAVKGSNNVKILSLDYTRQNQYWCHTCNVVIRLMGVVTCPAAHMALPVINFV